MKLTRNRIRKIRKQQHQSVRKWKKARKSAQRRQRHTFRRTREDEDRVVTGSRTTLYPAKLGNVLNKTLKKYIPADVLTYLKEKYDNMRRLRRRQRRKNKMMMGGADATQTPTSNPVVASDAKPAAEPVKPTDSASKTSPDSTKPAATTPPRTSPKGLNLPDIPGDIPIRKVEYELKDEKETYHLLEFLVNSGLPYYIQIDMKSGDKKFTKRDSDIFDLIRILYGKFAPIKELESGGKIPEEKRTMYFTAPNQVGIADGDTLGNEYPDKVFIFTKEKGQIDRESKELEGGVYDIKLKTGNDTVTLSNANRLYKLSENGSPSLIEEVETIRSFGNDIHPSEFRIQVVPMSDDDFKKAVEVSSGEGAGSKPGKKVVTDDANSYVVNLSVGCKITSIQTLRKTLEMVRVSLENEDDDTKTTALDVFKMLNEMLEDPEFMKNEGYAEFKKKVFAYKYKIPGSERNYGFTQLGAFFEGAGDDVSRALTDEYMKLLALLGQGPAGENGACLAFNTPGVPLRLKTVVTPLANGETFEQTTLENETDITGVARFLKELGDASSAKKGAEGEDEGAKDGAEEGAKDGETSEATAGTQAEEAKEGETPSTSEAEADIKEVDALDSKGNKYKAYVIKRFTFPDIQNQEMIHVHFMGWNEIYDEFIPASEESKRIFPRDSASLTGQNSRLDDTIDKIKAIYTKEVMAKKEEKAKEKARELLDTAAPPSANANSTAAAAAAAAAATAAAMAAASVAQSLVKKKPSNE